MILNVSRTCSNEIVYIESGCDTLKPTIYKRQLKFYRKLKVDCMNNPESPISRLLNDALQSNTSFLRHYKKLDGTFTTPVKCFKHYQDIQKREAKEKILQKLSDDPDSILGTYARINPELQSPAFYKEVSCHEVDRTIITRYRVGSHNLKIQNGRTSDVERVNRLCSCQNDIQTIAHVLFDCPLTADLQRIPGIQDENLDTFFNGNDLIRIATTLKTMEKMI